MANIGAFNRADYSKGYGENTRYSWEGQIELSSRNELPNPDFRDFDGGEPEAVELTAPGDPEGWGVLIRRIGNADNPNALPTHQTAGPLPVDRAAYYQDEPLVLGSPPQDVSSRALIASPPKPIVGVKMREEHGLYAGWRAVAYGWISEGSVQKSKLLTDPSPRSYIEILAGEGIKVPLPQDAPERAIGIYIAMTEACETQNEAATSPLWIQRRLDIQQGIRITFSINGPFRREERAPTENKTFVGQEDKHPAPKKKVVKNPSGGGGKKKEGDWVESWQFKTKNGWSKPQQVSNATYNTKVQARRAAIKSKPKKFPKNAIAWRPIVKEVGTDNWIEFEVRDIRSASHKQNAKPEKKRGKR